MDFEAAKEFILNKLRNELPKHLKYHSIDHVLDVFESSKEIAKSEGVEGEELTLLLTAALFHDSGFIVKAQGHEEISCEIAKENLPKFGYSREQIDRICTIIMATKIPQTPQDHLGEILADADLDYLGRDDFYEIGQQLYKELTIAGLVKNEEEWDNIQIKFFENHNYFTKTSINKRKKRKEAYLEEIKSKKNT